MFFPFHNECLFVFFRRLKKQVKRPFRLHAGESHRPQAVIKQHSVSVIDFNIYLFLEAVLCNELEQRRCIHISQSTIAYNQSILNLIIVLHVRRYGHISNSFSRKRKWFTEGIAYDTVPDMLRHIGHLQAIIYQFTVWFIWNNTDGMTDAHFRFSYDSI